MYKKPQLQIKNICYCYDGKNEVLKNVNLDIFAGEKIAIMGANGAGKSTLFLCMNGVLFAEKGDIIWEGEKIIKKNRKQLTKNIGIVFQDADNQIIAPTVLEEISFGPMNLKLSQKEVQKRVYSAMEKMGLISFENKITHYLSGGEKKKVTIADSIAMESKMILFDEPHTALDPFHQQVLEDMFQKLSNEGKTLIISTHDVDFAYRFAERVIVFYDGSVIADDITENVFCNEEVLKKSNLKQPTFLQIKKLLSQKGILKNNDIYPKNIEQLKQLL
ncbi:ABC transporter ATP-binding protein [Lachnospiraceae bacterium 46-61]